MIPITEDPQIKNLIKESIMELLSERREEIQAFVVEMIEDIGMSNAIEEGLQTPVVDTDEVLSLLEQQKQKCILYSPGSPILFS